jgi:hypothetical protein
MISERHRSSMFDEGWARFSDDRRHRYFLGRCWEREAARAFFLGENPSKAGAVTDDQTITKLRGFCYRLQCGSFEIANLSPLVSTEQAGLLVPGADVRGNHDEAIGAIARGVDAAQLRVACWGGLDRGVRALLQPMLDQLREIYGGDEIPWWCWGLTVSGDPVHPSRLGYSAKLERYYWGRR